LEVLQHSEKKQEAAMALSRYWEQHPLSQFTNTPDRVAIGEARKSAARLMEAKSQEALAMAQVPALKQRPNSRDDEEAQSTTSTNNDEVDAVDEEDDDVADDDEQEVRPANRLFKSTFISPPTVQ
jgi:hypothetical protein